MPGMELQLYMWSGIRGRLIERHDFYLEQVKARILSQFGDIEGEADRYAETEYDRLCALPWGEDVDHSEIAEMAHDRAISHYSLLHDLKKQVTLGALAGLYHQWDKDLRDFVEHELGHNTRREVAVKVAWDPNVGNVFGVLADFGWDCRSTEWFPLIDACRLVVNVYKHGKGRSLDDLNASYPEYFVDPLASSGLSALSAAHLNHEYLEVSNQQFDGIANSLRRFWEEFPERLFLTIQPSSSP